MSCKVFVVPTHQNTPVQIGGTWFDIGDASGDIDGGDFWANVGKAFPNGVAIKEIRIVPDRPITFGE